MKISLYAPYHQKLNKNIQTKPLSHKKNNYSDSLNGLECIARNNIAFIGGYTETTPVYAFSRDDSILKFDSINRASKALGVSSASIAQCISGKIYESQGYTFVSAKDIEKKNKDGIISLDKSIIKKTRDRFNDAKSIPIYAIDIGGNLKRFDSALNAAKVLDLSNTSVYRALSGAGHRGGDYVFVPANKIELKDDNGATIRDKRGKPCLDMEALHSALDEFSKSFGVPVCSIDCFGNISRYESESQCRDKLLKSFKITRDINDKINLCGKQILVAENVIIKRMPNGRALRDKDGNFLYDIEKINKLLETFESAKVKPVLVANKLTGESMEFESSSAAARALGVSRQAADVALKNGTSVRDCNIQYLYPRRIEKYNISYN